VRSAAKELIPSDLWAGEG